MTHWETLIWTGVAFIAGSYAHELTHYIVAWWFDADPRINWRHRYVEYIPTGLTTRQHRAIGLAPLAIGTAIAVGYLVRAGVPAFGLSMGPPVVGWAGYTLTGARSDFSIAVRRREATT